MSIVRRLLLHLIVLMLSGLPAAAVACDLLICADSGAPARSRCHGESSAAGGVHVVAGSDGCTHLVPVDPYIASGARLLLTAPLLTALADAVAPRVLLARAAERTPDRAPPGAVLPPFVPLRI